MITMYNVLGSLKDHKSIFDKSGSLLVVGDAKMYFHITSLASTYPEEYKNFVPFPGDRHILKNYQPVLMKVFYEAGIKQIAEATGYRGETLTSLANCSNFKRTNTFLLQLHEAFLREMISTFMKSECEPALTGITNQVVIILEQCTNKELASERTICESFKEINTLLSSAPVRHVYQHFLQFIESRCSNDNMWLFWVRFTMIDCMAYIALFLAIRSRNWPL